MWNDVVRRLSVLIEDLFSRLGNVDVSSFSLLFKLIGDHDVWPVYIVTDNLSANDPSNDLTRVDTDSHVKFGEIVLFSDSLNVFNHTQSHVDNILSLLKNVSLITIGKTQYHIAIADCVNLVNVMLEALFVKLFEKLSQHFDDYVRLVFVLFGKGGEAFDVGVEHGTVFKLVGQLKSVFDVLILELFVGVFWQQLGNKV